MSRAIRVLLADDENAIHETLGVYLSNRGYEVQNAMDGAQALQAIETSDFDLLIADIRLPGVDGLTLLEKVKNEHPEIFVIMITGLVDDGLEKEATGKGADGFLVKPFRLTQMDELIRELTTTQAVS